MPPKNSHNPEVITPVTEAGPNDPPAFVLSQEERQAIVQEVVRALATTANTVTTEASTAQGGQGTLPYLYHPYLYHPLSTHSLRRLALT
jgi:hypothetical protein